MRRNSSFATRHWIAVAAASLIASLACANSNVSESGTASSHLPSFVPIPVPNIDVIGPESPSAAIALSSGGMLAFTHGFDELDRVITIVDTNGSVRARFGRRGLGPTEVGGHNLMQFVGDTLLVADHRNGKLVAFDIAGKPLFSSPRLGDVVLFGMTPDSVDVFQMRPTESFLSAIRRFSVRTGEIRVLAEAADTTFGDVLKGVPAVVRNGRDIIVGNVSTYQFRTIHGDGRVSEAWGRNLEPIMLDSASIDEILKGRVALGYSVTPRQREELAQTPTRFYYGLAADTRGRIWVYGDSPDSSGSFADVFDGHEFKGRTSLPCRIRAFGLTFADRRAAMLCIDDAADSGVRLRLFRVVEGA